MGTQLRKMCLCMVRISVYSMPIINLAENFLKLWATLQVCLDIIPVFLGYQAKKMQLLELFLIE